MLVPIEEPQQLTPEQKEQMYWSTWGYDSHKWVEYEKGYYRCSFCDSYRTSMSFINNPPICEKNPYIAELIDRVRVEAESAKTKQIINFLSDHFEQTKP